MNFIVKTLGEGQRIQVGHFIAQYCISVLSAGEYL